MIDSLVSSAAILTEVKASTKDAALKELLLAAQNAGIVPKKSATVLGKKLLEREAIGSTGLGNGVAVPHIKHADIAAPSLVLARTSTPIEWQAIDGRAVSIMFLVVSPAADPEAHLQCLRWISTLARNADFRRFLLDAKDESAIRDLLRELSPKS
jgi:PTS system fructose-specific IIA component/PTS system nitrogen regulatory IIA component